MSDYPNAVELATELTVAWLSNPNTRADDVAGFLAKMHTAVSQLATPSTGAEEAAAAEYTPATTARKSLASPDHIVSMIDGKPYKTLRRHLSTHGMTPAEYRQRYGLKADYPMVAQSYSDSRREMAKKIGLGRKPGTKVAEVAPDAAAKPKATRAKKPLEAAKDHLAGE